jgi:hypothetical protein
MNHSKPEDAAFVSCASCAVLLVGAAFAVLLYQLIALAAPYVESMSSHALMASGL